MSALATELGIGRSTLYRKMKEYGLDDGEGDKMLGQEDLKGEAGQAA